MNIDGSTCVFGLIGKNISHTLSPLIHNSAARLLHKNAVYLPFDVPATALPHLLSVLWDMGALGFNVTTPHKEAVASLITNHPHISSMNTGYRGDVGWLAASTDGIGFARAIEHAGFNLSDFTDYVFLGNGGAVLALVAYLFAKPELWPHRTIHIIRRTTKKDDLFRDITPKPMSDSIIAFHPFEPNRLCSILTGQGRFLVVQGTSAPLRGDPLAPFAIAMPRFDGLVFDLVYGTPSALISRADALSIAHLDGLPMLIEQARSSQELWWGESASYVELSQLLSSKV